MSTSDTFLNDTWRAYVHHPNDVDWTRESYTSIGILSSVSDFWSTWNAVVPVVERTMLFFMREHIFPSWDDPACIDGCIASVIVHQSQAAETFERIVQCTLGEVLVRDKSKWDLVNGVSIGPKKGFCVIKIWIAEDGVGADALDLPGTVDRTSIRMQPCRKHIEVARSASGTLGTLGHGSHHKRT